MNRRFAVAAILFAIIAVPAGTTRAEEAALDAAALAKALAGAPVALRQGLKASASTGTPISAKYEIEKNALQLSVYTAKGGAFFEVIVDHKTGAIAKSEKITDKGDLDEAKEQLGAMRKAKMSLAAAVGSATKANPGYRAVSVEPALASGGTATASVVLIKGTETKKVVQRLD